ncbi:MAG TPA: hypothetical protein VK897_13410 [Anaerolineales bacterium]|nr:hypothetical protein [Anaerolineales bacterium]
MKRALLVLSLLIMLLSACGMLPADSTPALIETTVPALPSETATAAPLEESPVPTEAAPTEAAPNPKLPAAPFEAQTYVNEIAGFALDYPTGWTVREMVVGPRGTQVQFLSAPELADMATLPEGATRVSATIYQWDPKNDLAAYVANRKTAWEASGFQIVGEELLVLELGLPAVQFTVQTPESQAIFLFAALGDQYLELSGEGDLGLVSEIVQRVRPISP